jgi:hypothetical protein
MLNNVNLEKMEHEQKNLRSWYTVLWIIVIKAQETVKVSPRNSAIELRNRGAQGGLHLKARESLGTN